MSYIPQVCDQQGRYKTGRFARTTAEAFRDADSARWIEGPEELSGGIGQALVAAVCVVALIVFAAVMV